jgi:hypothetical protein
MKKYAVNNTIYTEQEILDMYWETWAESMWMVTKDPMDLYEEDCIMDFCILNNAVEVEE